MNNKNIIILSSGDGSNLQCIIDILHNKNSITIAAIFSDQASRSINRGLKHNINSIYLPKDPNISRASYDHKLSFPHSFTYP